MKTVLITRPTRQALKFQNLIKGIDSVILSTIEVSPLKLSDIQQETIIENSVNGTWSLFTSANAVQIAAPLLIANSPIAVVGDETANELKDFSKKASFIPSNKSGLGLCKEFCEFVGGVKGMTIMLFQGTSASEEVNNYLVKEGATILKFPVYKVIDSDFSNFSLIEVIKFINAADENELILTFFSGKTVKNFIAVLPEILSLSTNARLESIIKEESAVIVIGDKTKEIAVSLGFKKVLESESKQSDSMVKLIKGLVLPT
jgi:uroporphyrinogen-III synthase